MIGILMLGCSGAMDAVQAVPIPDDKQTFIGEWRMQVDGVELVRG
ncbi:MAG: hypothetical protein QF464_22430 [Myxococcota bacterium]|nr:hypothetical protein [Myxococcota bacterium]